MKPKHRLIVKVNIFLCISKKLKYLFFKHFDQFLKQHPLSVCENTNVFKKDQYWRSMTLKSNENDDLMMVVVIHPQLLSKVLR
jgi:hypothetical protein